MVTTAGISIRVLFKEPTPFWSFSFNDCLSETNVITVFDTSFIIVDGEYILLLGVVYDNSATIRYILESKVSTILIPVWKWCD